jgi:hypothetical protein
MSSWFPRPPLSGASRIPWPLLSCANRAHYSIVNGRRRRIAPSLARAAGPCVTIISGAFGFSCQRNSSFCSSYCHATSSSTSVVGWICHLKLIVYRLLTTLFVGFVALLKWIGDASGSHMVQTLCVVKYSSRLVACMYIYTIEFYVLLYW